VGRQIGSPGIESTPGSLILRTRTQVNVTKVYLNRLSTDELKTLDRLLERAGMTLPAAATPQDGPGLMIVDADDPNR